MMADMILDIDDDILKMLSYDTTVEALILKIGGKRPASYVCTPVERLDLALKYPDDPSHIDPLLDARNYIYKGDGDVINNLSQ